jgi:hypothetical protein
MSSETSIDAGADVRRKPESSDALQPWQLFTLAGLIGATVVVFFAKGQPPATVILLSLTIFAAAGVGVAALRTVGPLAGLLGSEGPRTVGGRTRIALEREKALVLRSIKELEFDRAMGKLSDKDFVEMSHRLRARAAGLMRQLDQGAGYRDQIQQEIERRVAPKVAAMPVAKFCSACGSKTDPDARFCKHCGANLEARS